MMECEPREGFVTAIVGVHLPNQFSVSVFIVGTRSNANHNYPKGTSVRCWSTVNSTAFRRFIPTTHPHTAHPTWSTRGPAQPGVPPHHGTKGKNAGRMISLDPCLALARTKRMHWPNITRK